MVVGVLDQIGQRNDAAGDTLLIQEVEIDVGDDHLFLVDDALVANPVARKEIVRSVKPSDAKQVQTSVAA